MSEHENAPTVEEEEVFDPSAMKKKKKSSKKKVPAAFAEDEEAAPAAPAAVTEDGEEELDFSKLKKKSKKKKAVPADVAGDEDEAPAKPAARTRSPSPKRAPAAAAAAAPSPYHLENVENDDDSDVDGENVDLGEEIPDEETGFAFESEDNAVAEPWIGTDRDYTYDEILSRVYRILHEHNPALTGNRKRYTMVPPQVAREGSKKTVFANVADIANRMRRSFEHLTAYIYSELGTSGSTDGAMRLIIKGRFQPKQIENVLRRYIVEYVTCKTCKSPETVLRKENRLYFMQCESCGSSRSVAAIQTGFKAQVGKRSRMKAAA